MFCGKCGAENPDGAAFCEKCGATLKKPPENLGVTQRSEKKKGKRPLFAVGMVLAIVGVLVLGAVLVNGGGKSSPQDAATYIAKAMLAGDGQKITGMIPEEGWKFIRETYGVEDKKSVAEEINADLSQLRELKTRGVKMTCQSVDLWTNDLYDWEVDELRAAGINASYTCNARVGVLLEYEGESDQLTLTIPLIQIKGKWYFNFMDADSLGAY